MEKKDKIKPAAGAKATGGNQRQARFRDQQATDQMPRSFVSTSTPALP
jgi:hypothetical protein